MADEIIINTSPQPEVIVSYNATIVQGGTGFTGSAGQIGAQGYTGSAAFGSLNTQQNTASTSTVTVSSPFPVTVGTVTITVDNNPVSIVATGDIIGTNTPTGYMQLFRNDVAIGQEIRFSGSSSSAAIPYNIVVTDTPGAGTHVYTLKATRTTNARFGSSAGPTLIATELANVRGYTGSIGSVANQSLDTTSNVEFASVESTSFKANNSDFITVSGNTATIYTDLIPSVDAGYDLGSVTNKWRSLYVSTNTIYIDNVAVSVVDNQLAVNDQQIGFGYTGSLGYVGSQGPIGYAGSQGIQGTQGTQGVQGVQGLQGLKGDTGQQGATGYVGSTGAQGDVGYVGSIGYSGSQGLQGIQGQVGYVGSQGDIGFTGSQGEQGIQGDVGYVGSQGDIGYVGSTGAQGNPGVSVNIRGEVATTSLLPTGAVVGDAYIVTADGNLYTWTSTEWLDVGQIVGPQGDQGNIGYTGSAGEQGDQGVQGNIGYTGSAGDQGIQGEIGYTGSTGDQGIQGEIGYTGSIGYAGSQGDQGSIGYTGSTGEQGIQGVQGEQGIQGEIGYTGSTGERGEQGFPGDQGPAGDNGANALWNFTSEYNSGAAYAIGDLATYDGSTWYRIDANGGNVGDTPSEGTFWTAIAAKGTQGEIGYVGSQGDIGYVGSQGDIGYVGSQGDIGYTGSQGDIGYTGSAGEQGIQGDIGYTGYVGSQGEIGYTGSGGEQGIQGEIGYVGSQGSQGEIGYTGSAGEQGIQGEIGYTGSAGALAASGNRGVFSYSATYAFNDFVTWLGSGFVMVNPAGTFTDDPNNDTTNWMLIASKGNDADPATAGQTSVYTRDALPEGVIGLTITISDSGSDENSPAGNYALAYWDADTSEWLYMANSNSVTIITV